MSQHFPTVELPLTPWILERLAVAHDHRNTFTTLEERAAACAELVGYIGALVDKSAATR